MILYNITFNIENDIMEDFLVWLKGKHIPDFLQTGLFTEYKLFKLISNHGDTPDTSTYALQFYLKDLKTFLEYSDYQAPRLQNDLKDKFGSKVIAFRTLLEKIN